MAKEVAEGVRILLDFNLDTLLLYGQSGEQEQYDSHVKNADCPKGNGSLSNGPKVSLTKHDSYLHEKPADQMKENINTQIIHSNFEFASQTAPIILATTALRERRKVSL